MNKIISAILLTVAGGALAAQAETVSLSATNTSGGFDVAVLVNGVFDAPHDNGDALAGFGFNFTYDNTVLQFTGETIGSLFDDLSSNPGVTAEILGAADAGFISPGDFTEPLTLATLHFTAIAPASTTVGVTSDAANLDQGLQYFSASDSFSASADLTPTPEPGTFLLGGLALVSAVLFTNRLRS